MNIFNINSRHVAIASNLLFKSCGEKLLIQRINYDLCHLLVTIENGVRPRFGVVIVEKGYIETNTYAEYISILKSWDYSRRNPDNFPILLMEIDSENETAEIGMQMGWISQNSPVVYNPVTQRPISKDWLKKLLDIAKAMNSTITMLSREYLSILRTFSFCGIREYGHCFEGVILYARAMTPQYPKQTPESKRRFEENDMSAYFYPVQYEEDEIDKYIFEAINSSMKNIADVKKEDNLLMLFNTDIQHLQLYNKVVGGYEKYKVQYLFMPTIENPVYEQYISLISPIRINKLTLCIRGKIEHEIMPIITSYTETIDIGINQWKDRSSQINDKLESFINVYDLIV